MLGRILFSYTVYYDYSQMVGMDKLCSIASSNHLVQYLVISPRAAQTTRSPTSESTGSRSGLSTSISERKANDGTCTSQIAKDHDGTKQFTDNVENDAVVYWIGSWWEYYVEYILVIMDVFESMKSNLQRAISGNSR